MWLTTFGDHGPAYALDNPADHRAWQARDTARRAGYDEEWARRKRERERPAEERWAKKPPEPEPARR
ncbi:hypothetical protein ACFWBM_16145 [Streptomyces sp. NPDC059980]|uniref:hypothetical protein n=1 Tax=Streptomyces sp. NPDC059980 TaxID=3347022 RepID=UPI0036A19DA7